MMSMVLFDDGHHLLFGCMDAVGSSEENPAEDKPTAGKVIREQRFSKVKISEKNREYHRDGHKERDGGDGQTLDGLVDTKSGDES